MYIFTVKPLIFVIFLEHSFEKLTARKKSYHLDFYLLHHPTFSSFATFLVCAPVWNTFLTSFSIRVYMIFSILKTVTLVFWILWITASKCKWAELLDWFWIYGFALFTSFAISCILNMICFPLNFRVLNACKNRELRKIFNYLV